MQGTGQSKDVDVLREPAHALARTASRVTRTGAQTDQRLTRRARRMRKALGDLLARCGIELDGPRPHDVRVLHPRFYDVALQIGGSTSLRDAYVDGLWDSERLDEVTYRVLTHAPKLPGSEQLLLAWMAFTGTVRNPQSARRSFRGGRHYQLGEPLFRAMLDHRLIYSCAYFRTATNLDDAQEAKLDLVCRKLQLQPGMRVLDIGCGWGGFARFAAERYGAQVVGVTVAPDQARVAARACEGLPVQIRLQSYHALPGQDVPFDAVVSIGMFEHVGRRNYARYFGVVRDCLAPDGLCLLQTIGAPKTTTTYDPWMDRHIFPGAFLPSVKHIAAACDGALVIEDWHNFGAYYDKTLMAWHERFERAWPELRARYDERFRRMWKCYLLTCAGAFRARHTQLWQIVFSRSGVRGGYDSVR